MGCPKTKEIFKHYRSSINLFLKWEYAIDVRHTPLSTTQLWDHPDCKFVWCRMQLWPVYLNLCTLGRRRVWCPTCVVSNTYTDPSTTSIFQFKIGVYVSESVLHIPNYIFSLLLWWGVMYGEQETKVKSDFWSMFLWEGHFLFTSNASKQWVIFECVILFSVTYAPHHSYASIPPCHVHRTLHLDQIMVMVMVVYMGCWLDLTRMLGINTCNGVIMTFL